MKKLLFLFLPFSLAFGQVGINTTSPHSSTAFEVFSINKGVLLPRVALTSSTDQVTIASPATGLMVFNTGTGGLTYTGYVFWNGSEWRALQSTTTITGSISNLNCSNATLVPASYNTGVPYTGTLTIPYTGGNGGFYLGQTIGPINGLTATISGGNFNVGAGNLAFTVSGTPTVTSPTTSSFNISIGGQSCTAVVGQGEKGFISEYAQVNFEGYGSATFGLSANGSLATLYAGNVNVARVKRLTQGVFRVDFIVPFQDDKYIVSGFPTEPGAFNGDDIQAYFYIPNFTRTSNSFGTAIMNDTDVNLVSPTNPSYNLNPRQTVVKPDGTNSVVVKYRTHFYIAEGWGHYPIVGGTLMITR